VVADVIAAAAAVVSSLTLVAVVVDIYEEVAFTNILRKKNGPLLFEFIKTTKSPFTTITS